ncbi:MAG: putative DNA binding domain-containing protein [Chloroflexota bacterium]|nr:putative DNA binding domain-containing protein [Chloroflexota bacterium]
MMESGVSGKRWIRIDLHIHTPASEDYAEPNVTFLDILREAERHNLEIIAFTDHNTVAGFEQMRREIDFLEQLVRMGRATAEDQAQFDEYQRLLSAITVLPGFEFTSHYGAHILGIFAPQTPISLIEATLLQLGVSADRIKAGATSVPDTEHITDAYELIAKAGGLVIAAHVNAPAGAITESLRMGTSGQSRVAATQSPYLHALEFVNFYTDHGTFTSPGFFNGRTDHYERRMFCIQGSDAHRVRRAPSGSDAAHRHGVGDRYFEALLDAPGFISLRDLFRSDRFEHVRVPKRYQKEWEVDQLRFGVPSERNVLRGADADIATLLSDVAALANVGGGTLVLGAASAESGAVEGVAQPDQLSEQLRLAVGQDVDPAPALSFELMRYQGGDILRVEVRALQSPPYVTHDGVIYVRRDGETVRASRGEILQLARRALAEGATSPLDNGQELSVPRSGVEIVDAQRRNGEWQYEIRDLRTTPGVVRERAQGLWAYAIDRHEDLREGRVDLESQITWVGRLGLWRTYRQGNRTKYDLVHRDANGVIDHVFYGVSDWGLSESWQVLLEGFRPVGEGGEEQPAGAPGRDELLPARSMPGPAEARPEPVFGDRRYRWRGNNGIWRIYRDADGEPRFDIVVRGATDGSVRELAGVPRRQLDDTLLRMIAVNRPRTGIEVVADVVGDDGVRRITFRDLRSGDISAPWRVEELKEGSVREYAARMSRVDRPLDDREVRWWGNIGYLRPMRSQVDLVYRDEQGVDHLYYAARREELQDEWRALLEQWEGPPVAPQGLMRTDGDMAARRQPAPPRTDLNNVQRPFEPPPWVRERRTEEPTGETADAQTAGLVAVEDEHLDS